MFSNFNVVCSAYSEIEMILSALSLLPSEMSSFFITSDQTDNFAQSLSHSLTLCLTVSCYSGLLCTEEINSQELTHVYMYIYI